MFLSRAGKKRKRPILLPPPDIRLEQLQRQSGPRALQGHLAELQLLLRAAEVQALLHLVRQLFHRRPARDGQGLRRQRLRTRFRR